MSLLNELALPACWEQFYAYKASLVCPKEVLKELRDFIDGQAYLPVCESIARGDAFPLPRRAVISKMRSGKKRVVYLYPKAENTVLKLLTWRLLRKYDTLFSDNLYSFRPGRTAKDAMRRLSHTKGLSDMHLYKVDISNYFNSVPVERLLPLLKEVLADDPPLFAFLRRLLEEPCVRDGSGIVKEEKGIMAGTPLSAFYANLYLKELDAAFAEEGIPYFRYSDDIIVLAETKEELEARAGRIRTFLQEAGLSVNPKKEEVFAPGEGFSFLGFSWKNGVIDIAPATLDKLKAKMRRKTRALKRWQERNGLPGEKAAAAFIRVFNRKLLESPEGHELSWSFWFFSVINTTASLERIDHYAQECLRYLVSGRRTKARFHVRYEDLKKLGYRSLVHAYYSFSATN